MAKSITSLPGHVALRPLPPVPSLAREVFELLPEDIEVVDEFPARSTAVPWLARRASDSVSRNFVIGAGLVVVALNAALTFMIVRMVVPRHPAGLHATLENTVVAPAALLAKPTVPPATPLPPPAQVAPAPADVRGSAAPLATHPAPEAVSAGKRPAKRRARVQAPTPPALEAPKGARSTAPSTGDPADEPEPQLEPQALAQPAAEPATPAPAPTETAAFSAGKTPPTELSREAVPAEPAREGAPSDKPQAPPP